MAKKDLKGGLGNLLGRNDTPEPEEVEAVDVTPTKEQVQEALIDRLSDEELKVALRAKRFAGGRPKKGEIRESKEKGYGRTCIVANAEKMAKIREIAFRETLTIKEVMEAAMDLAIRTYEAKHGEVIPDPNHYKGDSTKLFN